MPDMDYWLGRKYAIAQQQADATTSNASSSATAAQAAAQLDRTRAQIMPAESMASILQNRAQANLLNQQAAVVVPESQARITNLGANTGFTNMQTQALYKDAVETTTPSAASLSRVMGRGGLPSLGLSGVTLGSSTRRRAGETEAAYLDRINGF